VLDAGEQPVELGHRAGMKARETDRRIGLVHGAVTGDPEVVLHAARAAHQSGGAVVAFLRVDLVQLNHLTPSRAAAFVAWGGPRSPHSRGMDWRHRQCKMKKGR